MGGGGVVGLTKYFEVDFYINRGPEDNRFLQKDTPTIVTTNFLESVGGGHSRRKSLCQGESHSIQAKVILSIS